MPAMTSSRARASDGEIVSPRMAAAKSQILLGACGKNPALKFLPHVMPIADPASADAALIIPNLVTGRTQFDHFSLGGLPKQAYGFSNAGKISARPERQNIRTHTEGDSHEE